MSFIKWILDLYRPKPPKGVSFYVRSNETHKTEHTPAFLKNDIPQYDFYSLDDETLTPEKNPYNYDYPLPTTLLTEDQTITDYVDRRELQYKALMIEEFYYSHNIYIKVINIQTNPNSIKFVFTLDRGIRISEVKKLKDDLQLSLAADSVIIEAPIPGTSSIGIEIPRARKNIVHLRSLIETKEFKRSSKNAVLIGNGYNSTPIIFDFANKQHLFITGHDTNELLAIRNSLLYGILFHATPDEIKFLIIDSEISSSYEFNNIPYLVMPVITSSEKALNALKWVKIEIERRSGSKNKHYNSGYKSSDESTILLFINNINILQTTPKSEELNEILYILNSGPSVGIHLIISSRIDLKSKLYQAFNYRIADKIVFKANSKNESFRLINDDRAESLSGSGDMFVYDSQANSLVRGVYTTITISEKERITTYLQDHKTQIPSTNQLFDQAVETVLSAGIASVSFLQRQLGIGYPRAARLIDELEQKQIIGPFEGSKPRKVIISKQEWNQRK